MIGTWAVTNRKGDYLEYRVSEERARQTFGRNPEAEAVWKNVDPAHPELAELDVSR